MVERRGSRLTSAMLSKTLYSPKVLVIPMKRWLHPDMTEKLLNETLSLNLNQNLCNIQCTTISRAVKIDN